MPSIQVGQQLSGTLIDTSTVVYSVTLDANATYTLTFRGANPQIIPRMSFGGGGLTLTDSSIYTDVSLPNALHAFGTASGSMTIRPLAGGSYNFYSFIDSGAPADYIVSVVAPAAGQLLGEFIVGTLGADTASGGGGDDAFWNGAAGADTFSGGVGNDIYFLSNVAATILEGANEGIDLVITDLASFTLPDNVENLTFSNLGSFSGTGNALANNLIGGFGADFLSGLGGADTLDGGTGADTLTGGLGDDTYVLDNAFDVIVELAGQGVDSIQTMLTNVALASYANVENLSYFGSAAFVGQGTNGVNVITGGPGNDYVYAYDGNDTAHGGGGVDVFVMGAGSDTVNGGDGQDYIYGDAGNDTLNGDAGVDVLIGGEGNDVLRGGDGGDYFYGENGDDTGYGEAGNDIFVLAAGADTADGGDGQDYFYMGDGNDTLIGGAGVDVMLGEAGDDTFDPGLGVDYVFMGTGSDTLKIDKFNSGVTVLYDFTPGATSGDIINLTGSGWTSFAQVQANISDFTSSGGFCILTLDADTAIWFIGVAPGQLTAGDFVFGP